MANAPGPSRGRWAVNVVPTDESGIDFYLTKYKPFRLLALQESPSSFSSTYEQQLKFPDDFWIQRLTNPIMTTFVAIDEDDGKVLSSATLVGPQPVPDDPALKDKISGLPSGSLHWTLASVYTRSEARRTGLARAVLRTVWGWAAEKSFSQGSGCVVTADVMRGNHGAKALYDGLGFLEAGESDGTVRMVRYVGKEPGGS